MKINKKLLAQAVNQITHNPETHDQREWHSECGTKHSIAGWIQVLGDKEPRNETAQRDAKELIGLSNEDAYWLFNSCRHISEIHAFAVSVINDAEFFNRDGYDRDGYDRYGYNRDGYDRYEYDRDGYDRDGYNRDGYNRDGYNRDGYDRDGYDRDEYDRDGYDWSGYDRDGYDRDGYDRSGNKLPIISVKDN